MKKLPSLSVSLVILLLLTLTPVVSRAQCAMCRASVESSVSEGSSVAAGLNKGILYLLFTPYLAFAVLAFFWYRSSKAEQAQRLRVSLPTNWPPRR